MKSVQKQPDSLLYIATGLTESFTDFVRFLNMGSIVGSKVQGSLINKQPKQ